jgi:branched-chain amino acid transport system permease protein
VTVTQAAQDVRVRRSRRNPVWTVVPGVAVLAVLAYLPYLTTTGTTSSMVNLFILVTLGTTWNLLAGYAGLVSVGQQAYIGVGACIVYFLASHGVEPFIALPAAVVGCAIVSLPVSLLVFRLSGAYFAIATWVVSETFSQSLARDSSLGGGTGASLPGLGGVGATLLNAYTYWAALGVTVLTLLGSYLLLRSRLGLALTAVRDNEVAARSLGVRVGRAKRIVYLAAAAGGGGAGALVILSQLNVQTSNVFNVQWSAYMIFVVLIGGIGSLEGPILGAIVFFVLEQRLANYGGWYLILLGTVAVLMALFARRGLWGVVDRFDFPLFPVGYTLRERGTASHPLDSERPSSSAPRAGAPPG